MRQQKRWICHTCHREWAYDPSTLTIGHHWDYLHCPARDCGSTLIEHVIFTPSFPGGDYHRIAEPPPQFEPPEITSPDLLNLHENRTLAMTQAADPFDYGTS